MKSYPVLLAGALVLASVLPARAQYVRAKLLEPHDDPVPPEFLTEHSDNGFAVVEGVVGPDGKLVGGHVIAFSHADLAKYAPDAAKVWRYQPATLNGKAVPAVLDIPVWYNGTMVVTDDTLMPLVQAVAYINNNWAREHGVKTAEGIYKVQDEHKLGLIPLVNAPGSDHLTASLEGSPDDMKDAAEFINRYVGQAPFPLKSLQILKKLDAFFVILPKFTPQAGAAK